MCSEQIRLLNHANLQLHRYNINRGAVADRPGSSSSASPRSLL
jgi:hypothetical protein